MRKFIGMMVVALLPVGPIACHSDKTPVSDQTDRQAEAEPADDERRPC